MATPPSDLRGFVHRVLIALALVALALFLWRVADVLLLIFGASLVAVVLRALADPLRRRTRLNDTVALAIVVLALLGTLAGAGMLFGAEVVRQASELATRLPVALEQAGEALQDRLAGGIADRILDAIPDAMPSLGGLASALTRGAAVAVGAVVQLVIVLVGGLYLAGDPAVYRAGVLKLLPEQARAQVGGLIDASARALRLWLLGQLITMAAVGLLTGLGLWLIGMPVPFALGLLAGIAEFVPYVGPIAAAVPGLLIALAEGPTMLLYAALVYLVVQQIESNAIMPLVARQVLALPPALAIFAVVALGVVFGPLGLIFAAPLTVLLVAAVARLYVRETLGTKVTVPGETKAEAAAQTPAEATADPPARAKADRPGG